jgi:hypothetical protein
MLIDSKKVAPSAAPFVSSLYKPYLRGRLAFGSLLICFFWRGRRMQGKVLKEQSPLVGTASPKSSEAPICNQQSTINN